MKTIKIEGESKVVEIFKEGIPQRVVLPLTSNNMKLGAPYGLPFARLLELQTGKRMAQKIEDELHNRGIWTKEDILNSPRTILGAVQAAYKTDVQAILKLAKEE